MDPIHKALSDLADSQRGLEAGRTLAFEDFLAQLRWRPDRLIRNVHQVFHDMVRAYVGRGRDEYPDDPESINFIAYDFGPLLVEGSDQPFFADRIFANRFMSVIAGFRGGAQQNKIYLFEGPPGSGKSIFLNNLLKRFEEYANSPEGCRYETVWRLDRSLLADGGGADASEQLVRLLGDRRTTKLLQDLAGNRQAQPRQNYLEVPCPSHDNPLLLIPKEQRARFLDELFQSDQFKWNLSTGKEYDWVFRDEPCTICTSLYQALLFKLDDPAAVFRMIHARPYHFNRRLGEGITVFNPGDRLTRQPVQTNPELQQRPDALLGSSQVRYIFSRYARTNNGVFALMDLKGHNKDRLLELHNMISDGVHKVDEVEERVYSLFLGVMNPEDEQNISGFQSLTDRIERININYVLDSATEVAIYENIFGRHIHESFLPRVLENFARVIISSRLNESSPALLDWIGDGRKYLLYCDENLHLLKMAIYTGVIPTWLDEEDRKAFTARRRRQIIAEAETEGGRGFSGRDALDIFQDLYASQSRDGQLITMDTLVNFFTKTRPELGKKLPKGFLDALRSMYNYQTLQEVKESLFDYNEQQITRDVQNYLFALNFEIGTSVTCSYTHDKLVVTEAFLSGIEDRLLGADTSARRRREFRAETQRTYTSRTLTQEIMVGGKAITETELYLALRDRYVFHLKAKVLEPLLQNANFRRALKDYGTEDFKTYDHKIQTDVRFLIANLGDRYGYNESSAREVCLYVIDHNLAEEFAE